MRHKKGNTCPTINQGENARGPATLHPETPPLAHNPLRNSQPKLAKTKLPGSHKSATLGPRLRPQREAVPMAITLEGTALVSRTSLAAVGVDVEAVAAEGKAKTTINRTPRATTVARTVAAVVGATATAETRAAKVADRKSVAVEVVADEAAEAAKVTSLSQLLH